MNVRITDEARRGWDRCVDRHQLDLTALAEAIGLALDDRSFDIPPEIAERAWRIKYDREYPDRG